MLNARLVVFLLGCSLLSPPCWAALSLTIISAKLDRRRHKQPVNPRIRVEIRDRIFRSEPVPRTLEPRWGFRVSLESSYVKASPFIDFILYDFQGPGPDDEKMIAGKRLYPKDFMRPGKRRVRIGGADVVYQVVHLPDAAAAPVPVVAAPAAAPAPAALRVAARAPRAGPPIPPLRLFEPAPPPSTSTSARTLRVRRTMRPAGTTHRSIQEVIDAHGAEIDACHEKADYPSGELAMLFSISADGTPLGVLVEHASENLREVGECMRHKALKWRFPPSHGVVTARQRLTFGP